jgi:hypothetical protein
VAIRLRDGETVGDFRRALADLEVDAGNLQAYDTGPDRQRLKDVYRDLIGNMEHVTQRFLIGVRPGHFYTDRYRSITQATIPPPNFWGEAHADALAWLIWLRDLADELEGASDHSPSRNDEGLMPRIDDPAAALVRVRSREASGPLDPDARTYDAFISHASEDKATVARPLYRRLKERGFAIWFDEQELHVGDSLREKVDDGLKRSRFGIVVLSPDFFRKGWPKEELDGLAARQTREGRKVILPIWHQVSIADVQSFSPMLAGKMAASTNDGLDRVAERLVRAISAART